MKHDLALLPTSASQGAVGQFIAGCGLAFALTASLPAHALGLGITVGETYHTTDNQIEAKCEPIVGVLNKAIRQPVTLRVSSSYDNMCEAFKQQQIDLAVIHPAHMALQAANHVPNARRDTVPASNVRDTLLGLSQSDARKRAMSVSSYSAFVPASTDVEKTLIVRLGP